MADLRSFLSFLKKYSLSRILLFLRIFEYVKNIIVALLVVKRGKYSNSFLNSSLLVLIGASLIAGPIIADNNPFVRNISESGQFQAAVITYNPSQNPLSTVISSKPRDSVEIYEVEEGDTLESIALKFSISADTIRWQNDIDQDGIIKSGQTLEIPPIIGVVHEVSSGDNIYTIAKKYNTDPQQIVNFPFNDFVNLDTFQLTPGQTLYVPGGIIEEESSEQTQPSVATVAQIQGGIQGTSTYVWPTDGIITQYPVWYHMALDIASNSAPPILAVDSGTVSYVACIQWGYGCHIIIDHGNGYQTLYAHLSSFSVQAGQSVSQGQQIGIMGSTGRSTGPHLHFEIRTGGQILNPLSFLQ